MYAAKRCLSTCPHSSSPPLPPSLCPFASTPLFHSLSQFFPLSLPSSLPISLSLCSSLPNSLPPWLHFPHLLHAAGEDPAHAADARLRGPGGHGRHVRHPGPGARAGVGAGEGWEQERERGWEWERERGWEWAGVGLGSRARVECSACRACDPEAGGSERG
jgi:hypothetical protein